MSFTEIFLMTLLVILIFVLTLITFSSSYKYTEEIVNSGKSDDVIRESFSKDGKKSKLFSRVIYTVVSYIFTIILLITFTTVIVCVRNQGEVFVNDKTAIVVASNSMTNFYSRADESSMLVNKENAKDDQFSKGDICIFEKVEEDDELVLYDVYGYSYIDEDGTEYIILHRYVGNVNYTTDDTDKIRLVFKGDANEKRDSKYVQRNQIVLHYTQQKVRVVGSFILYLKSILGLISILCVLIVYILSEIYFKKYEDLLRRRFNLLNKEIDSDIKINSYVKPVEEDVLYINDEDFINDIIGD